MSSRELNIEIELFWSSATSSIHPMKSTVFFFISFCDCIPWLYVFADCGSLIYAGSDDANVNHGAARISQGTEFSE